MSFAGFIQKLCLLSHIFNTCSHSADTVLALIAGSLTWSNSDCLALNLSAELSVCSIGWLTCTVFMCVYICINLVVTELLRLHWRCFVRVSIFLLMFCHSSNFPSPNTLICYPLHLFVSFPKIRPTLS